MMSRLIIGIDVDGVLRDFSNSLRRVYHEVYPGHWYNASTAWELHEVFEIGQGIYDFCWRSEYTADIFGKAEHYEGALEMMDELSEVANVTIVTSQPSVGARRATIEWLDRCELLGVSGGVFLEGTLKRWHLPLDCLLDDNEKNLEAAHRYGIRAVCMDRPWNQNWTGYRVKTYDSFIEFVSGI